LIGVETRRFPVPVPIRIAGYAYRLKRCTIILHSKTIIPSVCGYIYKRGTVHLSKKNTHMYLPHREFEEQEEYAYEESRSFSNNMLPKNWVHQAFSLLLYIFFLSLLLYSIIQVSSSHAEFEAKCGEDGKAFFQFMIARLVMGFFEFAVLMLFACCISLCMGPCMSSAPSETFVKIQTLVPMLLILTLHAVLLGLGASYASKIANDECERLLSDISFTKSPLFLILGWIYVGIDALLVFIAAIGICVSAIPMFFLP